MLTDLKADNAAAMAAIPGPWGADVRSWQNYYPFGMLQPGRYGDNSINPNRLNYRYDFNGKEMDNEVHENPTTGTVGTGNSYDFGARMYDSRLGRWLSTDPQEQSSPSEATYIGFTDNPIYYIDPDGEKIEEPDFSTQFGLDFQRDLDLIYKSKYGKALIRFLHASNIFIGT